MRESGGYTWGYSPASVHPFHCWTARNHHYSHPG